MQVADPIKFGRFKGVNNKHDIMGLDVLATGYNVDIDRNNKARRRDGFNNIHAGSVTSLWASDENCLFVEGGFLKSLAKDLTTITPLTIIGNDVAYLEVSNKVYIMDGTSGFVLDDGVARQWGIATPLSPIISSAAGIMPVGRYSILITHVAPDGRESGASAHAAISTGGAVNVTNIIQPVSGYVRVYATTINGDVFYRVAELRNGETTFSFNGQTSEAVLEGRFNGPPVSGHMMCYHKGRIYVAVGDVIYYSEPFQFERFDLAYGYIQMNGRVTALESVNDGLYVSDGEIKFFSGTNPADFRVEVMAEYDAIEGTAKKIDLKYIGQVGDGVVMTTARGVCIGAKGGQFKNLTEDYVALKHGTTGLGLVRRNDGMVQYLSLITGDKGSPVNTYTPDVGQIDIR